MLTFLALCLILLSVAILALWLTGANQSNGSNLSLLRKAQQQQLLNWPPLLRPHATSSSARPPSSTASSHARALLTQATTHTHWNALLLPSAALSDDVRYNNNKNNDDDGESSGEAGEGVQTAEEKRRMTEMAALDSNNEAGTVQRRLEMNNAFPPTLAVRLRTQFVVEPDEFARWMSDGRMRERIRVFEIRDRNRCSGHRLVRALSWGFSDTFRILMLTHDASQIFRTHFSLASSASPRLPLARPLHLSSFSHNGVPVHPLQFQRLLRAEGVDAHSLVVLYDVQSAQQLWAHYALWIFRVWHQMTKLWTIFAGTG